MRKVIVIEFVSLDGVIQAPGGPEEDPNDGFAYGGWEVPYGAVLSPRFETAACLGNWRRAAFRFTSTIFRLVC
jgi:hypothetical protein